MDVVCAWCGEKLGKKDGRGVSGTSHSMCRRCFRREAWQDQNPPAGEDKKLGRILKDRRLAAGLTLIQLAKSSGVSQSHLGRIENGQRFPSARVLGKIAGPLGFVEEEILSLAGYLSAGSQRENGIRGLDPVVAATLAREPVETQKVALVLLESLKTIAGHMI